MKILLIILAVIFLLPMVVELLSWLLLGSLMNPIIMITIIICITVAVITKNIFGGKAK